MEPAQVDVHDDAGDGSRPTTRRRRTERGASLVEYALLVALIAIALITAVNTLGESGAESLDDSSSTIRAATAP